MELLKNFIYAGVGLATVTAEKAKETIDDLVEKGMISDTEGKKIIEDFFNSTEEKRKEFEKKIVYKDRDSRGKETRDNSWGDTTINME